MSTTAQIADSKLDDPCMACGFDSTAWGDQDTATTMNVLGEIHELSTEALPTELRTVRPSQGSWSVLDHLDHLSRVGDRGDPDRQVIHQYFHHAGEIARIRHELGDTVSMAGTVEQISASGGGVPKQPVLSAVVDHSGLASDRQNKRRHHGRPWQALCLWSTEVIDDLRAEGHTVAPGMAGENLTITGLDWHHIRQGLHLRIGDMHAVLTTPATPCSQIGEWFVGRDSKRIEHNLRPGWSRWYAQVRRGGEITPGDPVTITSN